MSLHDRLTADGPPPGVTWKQWQSARTKIHFGVVLLVIAVMLVVVHFVFSHKMDRLQAIPVTSLAEAKSTSQTVIKVVGQLHTKNPIEMPDSQELVIAGQLYLGLKSYDQDKKQLPLLEWRSSATDVVITDGNTEIPIKFSLDKIPWQKSDKVKAKFDYDGDGRLAEKVRVQYYDHTFELSDYDIKDPHIVLDRAIIPMSRSIVLVAGIENGELYQPSEGDFSLSFGSMAEVGEKSEMTKRLFLIVAAICFVAGIALSVIGRGQRKALLNRA